MDPNFQRHIMSNLKFFLNHVNIFELQNKISHFRDLDFQKISNQELQSEILKVISFNTPQGAHCVLKPMVTEYPEGTLFYRVRTLQEDNQEPPFKAMSTVADCWEPPESITQAGRLNKANEPLLYTAPDPLVAMEEMKILDNQLFSLIVYEAINPIKAAVIGERPDTEGLNEVEIIKAMMISDFLKHEFTRDVGYGTEYLYRISEIIAKDYFDFPQEFQDAWCYPSVAKKGDYNVCFKKENRSSLKLLGVHIGSIARGIDETIFFEKWKAIAHEDGTNLVYQQTNPSPQA